ncbi:XRE family transcriptional regulator [Streptomyces griseoviridis]|uniref:XRE family transcriptional regulator n=1 Tax=Streptomyces griseoviridis TaxID=45398 RepID=A0A3S9ZF80_STRGD|nr:helix-turn-helix transcriptional regulator [Streptomyces griseoviridis]AZS86436.1 XRE family transcriptional regulator [Streptomyces griseoviridis]QCN86702.1 XRE family transcriptional regulator [Streptomyces griseoviridis]
MASLNVGNLGEYLREQRRTAQLSLRQLADAAGVSNPYLSQIERGLRKPSAEVLQQVAKALRISAETLYVHAGILDAERDRDEVETRAVVLADPTLTEQQKQVLLQIYESFRKENGFGTDADREPQRPADAARPAADGAVAGPGVDVDVDTHADPAPRPGRKARPAKSTRTTPNTPQPTSSPKTPSTRMTNNTRMTKNTRGTGNARPADGGDDAGPQQPTG